MFFTRIAAALLLCGICSAAGLTVDTQVSEKRHICAGKKSTPNTCST